MTSSSHLAPARPGFSIAIVDDDPSVRGLMRLWLEREGYTVHEHTGGTRLLAEGASEAGVICLDLGLDDVPGLDLLQHLRARDPEVPIVVVTAERKVDVAVQAMRSGAYDYVVKPLERDRFVQAVKRAVERRELTLKVKNLRYELDERNIFRTVVGRSAPMQELARQVDRVLESDVAVCVLGESGTGKELVARAIHMSGHRGDGPFVAINCASIPASLHESELFGHEKGAFTGATAVHHGRFEQANGGTLFLDEIGEMSPATQAGLLRTLQERTIRRVGGVHEIPVNVRIVCATHRNLQEEVRAGRFREDLYFRIVVYPIHMPPLRDRPDDVPLLVAHFLKSFASDVGREVTRVTTDAMEALSRYRWPGNVRELQNAVHRAMLACEGAEIGIAHLPPSVREYDLPQVTRSVLAPRDSRFSDEESSDVLPLREIERRAVAQAMRVAKGNVAKAAKLLGMGRATLYRRIAELESSEPNVDRELQRVPARGA
jgi:DNA-binding NtrC family response regulator